MLKPFLRVLSGLFLAAAPLLAQESGGFTNDLKVRMAWTPSPKDHLSGTSLGLGIAFPFETSLGKVAVEVGYYYKTGDDYFLPPNGEAPAALSPVNKDASGDARRNQLDGFSVRFSLERKLSASWNWQAGVMVGGTRFRHEYHGDEQSQDWSSDNATSWRDTYSGVKVQGGFTFSPYVGLTWAMSERTALEFNLMAVNYKTAEYVHYPGTGQYDFDTTGNPSLGRIAPHNGFPGDTFTSSSRFVPHAEFGFSFHF